jgi:hypothetical protein
VPPPLASYVWRRGSVPLWWTVTIRNGGMGEAEIRIRNTNTFRGSRRYVRRLQKRYMPNPHLDPDPPEAPPGAPGRADPSLEVRRAARAAGRGGERAGCRRPGGARAVYAPSRLCRRPNRLAAARPPNRQVPVVFFSLLRKGTPDRDRSEAKLAEAFDFVAAQVCGGGSSAAAWYSGQHAAGAALELARRHPSLLNLLS